MIVHFTDFYAPFWKTVPERLYLAARPSRSGASLWIWRDGKLACVPACCLRAVGAAR